MTDQPCLEVPFDEVEKWEKIEGSCARLYAAAEWGYKQALATPPPEPPSEEDLLRLWQFNFGKTPKDRFMDIAHFVLALAATPPPEAPPTPDLSALAAIGERLRTQDNRCTAHPAFQVRGLRRIYGMDLDYADEPVWIDNGSDCIEVDPPEDPENPGDFIIKTGYQDHWEIIMVAFSEQACLDYIKHNGHRHGVYRELEVYADSFYRCPEMLAIREALIALPGESAPPPEPEEAMIPDQYKGHQLHVYRAGFHAGYKHGLTRAPAALTQPAPPTDEERLADFAQWLAREMPPNTIIGDPLWWAPRIWRAVHKRWGQP